MPEDGKKTCCHCAARKHTPRSDELKADVSRRINDTEVVDEVMGLLKKFM